MYYFVLLSNKIMFYLTFWSTYVFLIAQDDGPSLLGWVDRCWIQNNSNGLRINTVDKIAATKYRCRAATVWGVPDGSASLDLTTTSEELDVTGPSGPAQEDLSAERSTEAAANAATQAAIETSYVERPKLMTEPHLPTLQHLSQFYFESTEDKHANNSV